MSAVNDTSTKPTLEESFFTRNFWKNVANEIPIFNTTFTLSFLVATAFTSINASVKNFDGISLATLAAFPLVRKIDSLFLRNEYKEHVDFGLYSIKSNRESIKLFKLLNTYPPSIDKGANLSDDERIAAILQKSVDELTTAAYIFNGQQTILHSRLKEPPIEKYHFFDKIFKLAHSACMCASPAIALAGLMNKNTHSFTHFILTASLYTSFRQYSFPSNLIFGSCLGISFIDTLFHVAYKTSIYEQMVKYLYPPIEEQSSAFTQIYSLVQPREECIPYNLENLCPCPNNIVTPPNVEPSSYFLPILTGMAAVTILGYIALKYYDKYQKNRAQELAIQSLKIQEEKIKRFRKANADYGFTEILDASRCFNDPKRYLMIKYPLSSLKFFKSLVLTSARVVGYIAISLLLIPTLLTQIGRSYLRRNTVRIFTNLTGMCTSLIGIGFPFLGSKVYALQISAFHLENSVNL